MERRNTVQRELVLQAVRDLKTHSTADEVYSEIIKTHPSVSRGTVYRNLNVLADEGSILRVSFPGEAERFDFMTHDHYHVKCVKCGRVFDVDMDPVPGLMEKIRDPRGMRFLHCELLFSGMCPACGEAE